MTVLVEAGGATKELQLESHSSSEAFAALLEKGPLTVDMSDYGSFEKVGDIGMRLPENNKRITTKPGDVILYQGTSITIYYSKNSWNFTKLGEIKGETKESMLEFLGSGDVSVTFRLPK